MKLSEHNQGYIDAPIQLEAYQAYRYFLNLLNMGMTRAEALEVTKIWVNKQPGHTGNSDENVQNTPHIPPL